MRLDDQRMTDYYDAFEISPVPPPGPDAKPPEIYRGIYGMPMYVTVPTPDLAASVDFWTRGLGFVDLFTVPGQITHLRRWLPALLGGRRRTHPPRAHLPRARPAPRRHR
ncbi:VOC family protein [Actinomadura adrarensis]|uniref:VOC family protein n=1 Tax=Actinomadura adrarensis TaxID=1819600 RepID=A0ABW3CN26_9ACTN